MTERNISYTFTELPNREEEMMNSREDFSSSPAGAAAGCIAALKILSTDPEQGEKMLRLLNPDVSNGALRLARGQLLPSPWIIHSLFAGTSPENGYSIPGEKTIELSTNPYSGSEDSGSIKFFVKCSGADSPRPITVRRNTSGKWYPHEWSSLLVGIREPARD